MAVPLVRPKSRMSRDAALKSVKKQVGSRVKLRASHTPKAWRWVRVGSSSATKKRSGSSTKKKAPSAKRKGRKKSASTGGWNPVDAVLRFLGAL